MQQDKVIAKLEDELRKTAIAPVRLNELAASNTEIKKSLTDLFYIHEQLGADTRNHSRDHTQIGITLSLRDLKQVEQVRSLRYNQ